MTSTKTKLTPKQAAFVSNYLIDLNASAAAVRSGYSPKTAKEQGYRLLTNVHVAAAIAEAQTARLERNEVSADKVVQELARIAFADPRKLFDANGAIKPLDQIDADTRSALVIEITEGTDTHGNPTQQRKVKFADKLVALHKLARHLGLFRDRLEIAGSAENPIQILIQKIQGSALPIAQEGRSEDAAHRRAA